MSLIPGKMDPLQINNLYYFNAHTRSDEDVKRTFIVRKEILQELIDGISNEDIQSIPQHYMIIGSRGMGKSTLLRRLEIEIRTTEMKEHFIPILFPEEQYNIDRLSKFWLNSLDALADTFEEEKNEMETEALDQLIKALGAITDENTLSDDAFDALKAVCARHNRRPVFLIDNIDILFDGISKDQQFKLRKNITGNGAPIFVGASTQNPDESLNYEAAFYDAFDNIYLSTLSNDEMSEMLVQLARETHQEKAINEIYNKTAQLDALHSLTGGNPRVAVFMFQLIANGLSDKIFENLNVLLDLITPLYKSNFEQLSKQAQVIVDALALNWDPCDLDMLSKLSKLENNQLSSQLDRLIKAGWVERGSRFSVEKKAVLVKNKNYSIRERFFNIWYIMRRASRRQRGDLKSLTCFLETFYTREHLAIEKLRIVDLIKDEPNVDKVTYGLALALAHNRDSNANEMENEIYSILLDKTKGDKNKIAAFLNPKDIPSDLYNNYIINNGSWVKYLIELESLKDEANVEIFINAVINKKDNDPYVWLKYGKFYERKRKYIEAEQAYLKSINADKNYQYAWTALGNLKQILKRYEEAESDYKEAIKINDKYSYAWDLLGNLKKKLGQYDEAENLFRHSISIDKSYRFSWSSLGSLFIDQKKYDEAESILKEGLYMYPDDEFILFYTGYYLQKLNKDREAIKYFEKAIEVNENASFTWSAYSFSLKEISRFEDAEIAYKRLLILEPDSYINWAAYGQLLSNHLGKYNEAQTAYENSIKINPSYVYTLHELIFLERDKLNNIPKAIKLFGDNKSILEILLDSYQLQQALFATYEKNWGIAKDHWLGALTQIGDVLPEGTKNDWFRAIAITQKLGYGKALLQLFTDEEVFREFRPMFEALKTLEIGDNKYLLNVAEEVSKPAEEIYEYMKKYQE